MALVLALGLVAGLVAGWSIGRRGRRRARRELGSLRAQLDAAQTDLTAKSERLSAALAQAERLRQDLDETETALMRALVERGRAEQEVLDVRLAAQARAERERHASEALQAELTAVRADLAAALPAREELRLRAQYVETLQRELTLRDERTLRLSDRLAALAAASPSELGAPAGAALAPRREPADTVGTADTAEPGVEADLVIDLTDGTHAEPAHQPVAANDDARGTDADTPALDTPAAAPASATDPAADAGGTPSGAVSARRPPGPLVS